MSLPPDPDSRCSAPASTPARKGTARLRKADRLRQRADFLRVRAQGKRFYTRHFGLTLAPAAAGCPRLGLVVTKRLGKAVRRNRVKRLLREFFRRHLAELPWRDIVIMAKAGAEELNYQQVEAELGQLLRLPKDDLKHD